MQHFSFPNILDTQLFKAAHSTRDAQLVVDLIKSGARLDVPFHLNYEIIRGKTTRLTFTALEVLVVGWDLPKLAVVLDHIGPLPDIVLPNIASALHEVSHDTDTFFRGFEYPHSEKMLLWSLTNMLTSSNLRVSSFGSHCLWECIAHKNLEDKDLTHLPLIVQALGNLPLITNPYALHRVAQIPQHSKIKLGVVLCTKLGVDPVLHTQTEYQMLEEQALETPWGNHVARIILEQHVGHLGCSSVRKM